MHWTGRQALYQAQHLEVDPKKDLVPQLHFRLSLDVLVQVQDLQKPKYGGISGSENT